MKTMSPWEKILEQPPAQGHYVQLYETDEAALTRNVCTYLWEGLRRGEGALVIVTSEHRELFSRQLDQLGADLPALLQSQQLLFLDTDETLAEFMVAGQPNWQRFEKVVRGAMREVRTKRGIEGLRAYGEMVGVLWKNRQFAAAIHLEQLWNRLLERSSFSLYCAYAIDLFGRNLDLTQLESVLCTHTHLVPADPHGALETALERSLDEVLGPEADSLRMVIKAQNHPAWTVLPNAERMIVWLRKNLPGQAEQIVTRAMAYYRELATVQ